MKRPQSRALHVFLLVGAMAFGTACAHDSAEPAERTLVAADSGPGGQGSDVGELPQIPAANVTPECEEPFEEASDICDEPGPASEKLCLPLEALTQPCSAARLGPTVIDHGDGGAGGRDAIYEGIPWKSPVGALDSCPSIDELEFRAAGGCGGHAIGSVCVAPTSTQGQCCYWINRLPHAC